MTRKEVKHVGVAIYNGSVPHLGTAELDHLCKSLRVLRAQGTRAALVPGDWDVPRGWGNRDHYDLWESLISQKE